MSGAPGLPAAFQPASQPLGSTTPSVSAAAAHAAAADMPQIIGGAGITPEQHRQLQQQAAVHAQRISTGLAAAPDALRMPVPVSGPGAPLPLIAGQPQPAQQPVAAAPRPRPQWLPQQAGMRAGLTPALQQQPRLAPVQQAPRPFPQPTPPVQKRVVKKKPLEKVLADKVANFVPQSALFQQMSGLEKEVDGLLARKRAEAAAALRGTVTVPKKLRVYVFTTATNQPTPTEGSNPAAAPAITLAGLSSAPSSDTSRRPVVGLIGDSDPGFAGVSAAGVGPTAGNGSAADRRRPDGGPAAWCLHVYGRLLEPSGEAPPKGALPASEPFSHYLRRLTVRLGPDGQGQEEVTWRTAQHTDAARDSFEIRRLGSDNLGVKITLEVSWQPQRFKLLAPLASLLGVQYQTRARALQGVCDHISRHKLQDAQQPASIQCDARLKAVLGEEAVGVSDIADRLAPHFSAPAPPLEFAYTVRPSGASPSMPDCYDIDIEVPLKGDDAGNPLLQKLSKEREAEPVTTQLNGSVKQINEHARRRTLLLGFSHSPAEFLNGIVASQAREARVVSNEPGQPGRLYTPTRTELFHGAWVEDAALKYMRQG